MPDVVYEHIGFFREDQQRVYDHRNPRGLEMEFYLTNRADVQRLEYFWRDRRATTKRFMIPTWRDDMRMTTGYALRSKPNMDHLRLQRVRRFGARSATRRSLYRPHRQQLRLLRISRWQSCKQMGGRSGSWLRRQAIPVSESANGGSEHR